MPLDRRLEPWSGAGYRHLPAFVPADKALDFSRAGLSSTNRWNVAGEPTLYIAGDIGLAIAEWGRHFAENRNEAPGLIHDTVERTVYRLDLTLAQVLDLRAPDLWADLMLARAPHCFLDRAIARATAQFIRYTSMAQGVLVPSVAMLDDLTRWNLVLFLEKLPADPVQFITSVTVEGPLRWR